jgi:hypothetical protein
MEEMRKAAFTSVARGCGFGLLGIFCVMVGFSYDVRLMFQTGGMLTMIAVLVLALKARFALSKNYKHTEMWLMLPDDFRPPEAYAQWAAATVLRDAYFTFAQYTAGISVVMWSMALIMRLIMPMPA